MKRQKAKEMYFGLLSSDFRLKKIKMKKRLLFLVFAALTLNVAFAQPYKAGQIVVAIGGDFNNTDDHAYLVQVEPVTGHVTLIDSMYSQSVQCVMIDSGFAYVSAQDSLHKFNLTTSKKIASTKLNGTNQLAAWGNYIIAGRGYPATNKMLKILNKSDLSEAKAFSSITGGTWGIGVWNDTAYVAVPGNYGTTTGSIAVIDLFNQIHVRDIDLDTLGAGIRYIYIDGNMLYAMNTIAYLSPYSSIAKYDIQTGNLTFDIINRTMESMIGYDHGVVYAEFNDNVAAYNLNNSQFLIDSLYGLSMFDYLSSGVIDTTVGTIYVNITDFMTNTSSFNVMTPAVGHFGSYPIGLNPDAVAIFYYNTIGMDDITENEINIYPNPVSSVLTIKGEVDSYQLLDVNGRIIKSEETNAVINTINVTDIPSGLYFLKTINGSDIRVKKLIVE
jgi:hypothetical protein